MQDAGRNELLTRAFLFVALVLGTNTAPLAENASQAPVAQEIKYISSDLRHVAVFSRDHARFGPRLALSPDWGSSPARYFNSGDQVQCVSVGPPGNTEEFAVKRPLRVGERYNCLTTTFRVTRCFEACRAATIERVLKLANRRGNLKSYMYVDNCLGVLAFSQAGNLAEGIPVHAPWLRGTVGILAEPQHSKCYRF